MLGISGAGASRRVRHLVQRHRVAVTLADQCLVSGVNFLSNILLVRFLGLEEFGRFTLLWMIALFVNSLLYAAIIQPMLTLGPKRSEAEAPVYYGAVIALELAAAAIAFVAIAISIEASALAVPEWGIRGLAIPLAAATVSCLMQDFLRRYLFVRGRTFFAAVNDAVRYIGQLILLYTVAATFSGGLTVARALWVIAAAAMLGSAHGVLYLGTVAWSPLVLWESLLSHWRVARWLLPSALMYWTTGQAFYIAAGAMLGTVVVGTLRAAQAIVGVVHILLMGMDNFAPAQASAIFHQQGGAALRRYLWSLTWKISMLVLPLFLLIYLNSGEIGRLMYGVEYHQLDLFLLGFSVCYFVALLNAILGVWALAIESTKAVFISLVAATMFTALAAYPLALLVGTGGVIVGFLLVEFIRCMVLFNALTRNSGSRVGSVRGENLVSSLGASPSRHPMRGRR